MIINIGTTPFLYLVHPCTCKQSSLRTSNAVQSTDQITIRNVLITSNFVLNGHQKFQSYLLLYINGSSTLVQSQSVTLTIRIKFNVEIRNVSNLTRWYQSQTFKPIVSIL